MMKFREMNDVDASVLELRDKAGSFEPKMAIRSGPPSANGITGIRNAFWPGTRFGGKQTLIRFVKCPAAGV